MIQIKNSCLRWLAVAAAANLAFATLSAVAQTAKPSLPPVAEARSAMPFAVLDLQRVLTQSQAGKSVLEQLDQLKVKYRTELNKLQEKIRAEQEDLARQQGVLSPEAFEEKRRAYQRDASDLQQTIQDRNTDFELNEKRAQAEILRAVEGILKQYLFDHSISFIFDRVNVLMADSTVDVTNDVMQLLNKQLPSVKLGEGGSPTKPSAAAKKTPPAK
jgi:Skp family chaperone for outer membrane proteins